MWTKTIKTVAAKLFEKGYSRATLTQEKEDEERKKRKGRREKGRREKGERDKSGPRAPPTVLIVEEGKLGQPCASVSYVRKEAPPIQSDLQAKRE
jgi:hypothetical protein